MGAEQAVIARLGAALVEHGWVAPAQFREALEEARRAADEAGATTVSTVKAPPRQVGRFVLVRELGRGGFGSVWKAWQTDLNRFVALKFLRSDDPEDVRRFVREARTAAGLSHPNLVPIHEVGEHEGVHYIAMEYIEGGTLARVRLAPRDAAAKVRDAALAIEFAHAKGVIHRDLKPQNMMLEASGRVWVMDFGLARSVRGDATVTATGLIVGTPAYMPPEQAQGRACDARSDVYSLGGTLYEMTTGAPPFRSETSLDVLRLVVERDPVSPRRLAPALERDLETIILKAMEKDPARRYASAGAFAEDLRRYLAGEPIVARPAGSFVRLVKLAKRRPAGAVIATVAVVAVVFFAVGAARFRLKVADIVSRARGAESGRQWREARDLYAEARALVPGHAAAEEGRHRAERERAADERRRRALEFIAKGDAAVERHRKQAEEAAQRATEVRQLTADIPLFEGEEKKKPLWEAQRRAETAEGAAAFAYADIVEPYLSAIAADPDTDQAKRTLGKFHLAEFERAEAGGDVRGMRLAERLATLWDPAAAAERLRREGTVEIESDPPGAEIAAFRYEEGPDRRLVERPFPWSRGAKMPGGSYLFALRKPGFRDVRVPVWVGRRTAFAERVTMLKEEEIGAEFVYVPAGPFIMGGDPAAYAAVERQVKRLEGFCIARFETTTEEYVEFVNDLIRERGAAEARKRLPRTAPDGGWYWEVPDGASRTSAPAAWAKRPVYGVSWEDAVAYAAWKSKKDGRTYRLPTNEEWEKAARGADGRLFPWGDVFDWSFCKTAESRERKPAEQEAIGAFPKDESPYGVRDMAGSIREWCADWYDEKSKLKHMRSGSWGDNDAMYFRCATRFGYDLPTNVYMFDGFRLAHTPR